MACQQLNRSFGSSDHEEDGVRAKTIYSNVSSLGHRLTDDPPCMRAMDPAPAASKMLFDSPAFRVHDDGRVERFFGTDTTDPGFDAATGVTSKDVVLDSATGVLARLYLPALPDGPDRARRLPILVYFHGGGLVLGSAASQMYHAYLNSVASRAGVLAVSVDYRLAPEHPIPAAYEDSWLALSWAASGADPWLSAHGDAGRIFLAGDSGGANIVHNMAIKAGGADDQDGLPAGALVERTILLHPMFGGKEPVDGEAADTRYYMEKLWALICPDGDGLGVDDPRLNPMAPAAPSLRALAGRRLLVCSAERDFGRARAAAYYQAVKGSGWPGTAEWLESPGEEHGFFLLQPERDESSALMDRVVAFLSGE